MDTWTGELSLDSFIYLELFPQQLNKCLDIATPLNEKHTNQSGKGYTFRLQDNNGGFLAQKRISHINMHQVEFFFNKYMHKYDKRIKNT